MARAGGGKGLGRDPDPPGDLSASTGCRRRVPRPHRRVVTAFDGPPFEGRGAVGPGGHRLRDAEEGWGIRWEGDELKAQVPVLPNRASMEELAEEFHRVLAQGPAVPAILVAGHGVTVWGSTPREARDRLEIAEFLCQALWQQRLAQP